MKRRQTTDTRRSLAIIPPGLPSRLFHDAGLGVEQLRMGFSSGTHSRYLSRHRASTINERIRLLALSFGLLIPLWSVFDYLLLTEAVAFYLLTSWIIPADPADPGGRLLTEIYHLLPFVIIAGLTLFPLTLVESMTLGASMLVMMLGGAQLVANSDIANAAAVAWMLLLLVGIGALSGAIQLNYVASLLGRVSSDPLTGAISRAAGREMLDIHFTQASDQQQALTLAFVDLDHFKAINDQYGHDAGDRTLVGAVKALKEILRRGDHVIRWGGEEFLLILADTDIEGAGKVMAKIRHEWLGQRPDGSPLTASIGVAELHHDSAADWSQLVQLADHRMYLAKEAGRARAVLADEPVLALA